MRTAQDLCTSPAETLTQSELAKAKRWKRNQTTDTRLTATAETVLADQPHLSVDDAYRVAAEAVRQKNAERRDRGPEQARAAWLARAAEAHAALSNIACLALVGGDRTLHRQAARARDAAARLTLLLAGEDR